MNIIRSSDESKLADHFEQDLLSASRIIPGIAKEKNELDKQADFDFMNDFKLKKSLEKIFGNSVFSVSGKTKDAAIMAFSYADQTFFCISENKEIGTSWYWIDSGEEGSRFGKPMLLSCNDKVKDFWPDFCQKLKESIKVNPVRKPKF